MKKLFIAFAFAAAALAPAAAQSKAKPAWVDKPYSAYPDTLYISAVSSAPERAVAEKAALGSLAASFKQFITNRITISDSERLLNGVSSSETNMSQFIESSSALDTLIRAEIKETWNDTKNKVWYALAVMDKRKCAALYNDELDKLIREIKVLIDVPDEPAPGTAARCKKALELAEKASLYALVLSRLDGGGRQNEVYPLISKTKALLDKAKNVAVYVRVAGDVNDRVRSAFASVFSGEGFKIGGSNSRFVMDVTVSIEDAPKTMYFNARYTVTAVLTDTKTGSGILTYSISERESHPAGQKEANSRAITGAQRTIGKTFPPVLREYLNLD
ncbi:MAG: LPP20 family lipoprotein [Spirochaetaceae bacterium]|jgi:hypothetical protein|nr:LPP20 family lipoprotein [Spirochaetaceae bacterium]